MEIKLDERGKQCPLPVIETKNAIAGMKEAGTVEVAVDNEIAVQNLRKMAKQKNLKCTDSKRAERDYLVTFFVEQDSREENKESEEENPGEKTAWDTEAVYCPDGQKGQTVVVLAACCMGEGDEKLGKALMKGYIYALSQLEELPDTIIMYNSGAYLPVEGSDSLEDLKALAADGVEILTCGTCLNHYGLTEKLAAGSITDMYTIAEKMSKAVKIIKP